MAAKPVWEVGSLREVAEFFGVALSTVKGEWRPARMPGKAGAWDLKEILAWRDARRRPAAATSDPDNKVTIDGKDLSIGKLVTLEAFERYRRRKIGNDRLAGELVSRDDVERGAAELVLRLKERFEAVPEELQMEFPGAQRVQWRQRLESKVRLILTDLASWGERTKQDVERKNDAPADGARVAGKTAGRVKDRDA